MSMTSRGKGILYLCSPCWEYSLYMWSFEKRKGEKNSSSGDFECNDFRKSLIKKYSTSCTFGFLIATHHLLSLCPGSDKDDVFRDEETSFTLMFGYDVDSFIAS
jgi:hypothetical protein